MGGAINDERLSILHPGDCGGWRPSGHTGQTTTPVLVGQRGDGRRLCYKNKSSFNIHNFPGWSQKFPIYIHLLMFMIHLHINAFIYLTMEAMRVQSHIEGYVGTITVWHGAGVYSLI